MTDITSLDRHLKSVWRAADSATHHAHLMAFWGVIESNDSEPLLSSVLGNEDALSILSGLRLSPREDNEIASLLHNSDVTRRYQKFLASAIERASGQGNLMILHELVGEFNGAKASSALLKSVALALSSVSARIHDSDLARVHAIETISKWLILKGYSMSAKVDNHSNEQLLDVLGRILPAEAISSLSDMYLKVRAQNNKKA